jgi:hypothetical protein
VARLLGVTPQAVNQWPETVPLLAQYRLNALRPKLFPRSAISETTKAAE